MPIGPIETVRVFTRDIARARPFYEEGLRLTPLMADGGGVCLYDTGQAKLLLEQADPASPEEGTLIGRFAGLSFTVESMGDTVAELTSRGIRLSDPPETQPWGGVLAHFADPDGNILTLVEYPAPA